MEVERRKFKVLVTCGRIIKGGRDVSTSGWKTGSLLFYHVWCWRWMFDSHRTYGITTKNNVSTFRKLNPSKESVLLTLRLLYISQILLGSNDSHLL